MKAFLLIFGLLLLIGTVQAKNTSVTGKNLYEMCQSSKDACANYIVEAADQISQNNEKYGIKSFCLPSNLANDDLRRFVMHDMDRHPENKNLDASVEIELALGLSYPCN